MLVKCPECGLQVSDKASACPHCGYPMKSPRRAKNPARMRLPNGFGQISEIKQGNLRNRFRAMVNVGFREDGRPIAKILKPQGYFATYNDAYMALLEYHKDPRAFGDKTTLRDIYPKWKEEYVKGKTSQRSKYVLDYAFRRCESILDMPVQDVRAKDIKRVIDENAGIPKGSMTQVRNFLNQAFDYCVTRELIERNPAREFVGKTKTSAEKHHKPFEDWEIETLWSHSGENIYTDMILIACYSGWRPSELCDLKTANISDESMTGGMKTDAGKNRVVPIHPRIKPLVERHLDRDKEYLFNRKGKHILYQYYADKFNELMTEYQLSDGHKPHDCRVQFVSSLKSAEVDEYLIKRLVGHSITDITENIYTKRSLSQLREAVKKIK